MASSQIQDWNSKKKWRRKGENPKSFKIESKNRTLFFYLILGNCNQKINKNLTNAKKIELEYKIFINN